MNAKGKYKFLVAYDFGAGDNWRMFSAKNRDEITQKCPEFVIYDYEKPPEWMSKELFDQIEAVGISDIDDFK